MPKITITTWKSLYDSEGKHHTGSWDRIARSLTRHREQSSTGGMLWSPTIHLTDLPARGDANVDRLTALVLDIDTGMSIEELRPGLELYEWVAHSTFSHTHEHPKYRIVLPLDAPVPASEWPSVWETAADHLACGNADESCRHPSRLYYVPSCAPAAPRWAEHHAGAFLDLSGLPQVAPKPVAGMEATPGVARPKGGGDYKTLDVAAWFRHHGCYGRYVQANQHAVQCPWSDEHTMPSRAEDSDTVIFVNENAWPGFFCHHAHCRERRLDDVMELWGDADRFCSRAFKARRGGKKRG